MSESVVFSGFGISFKIRILDPDPQLKFGSRIQIQVTKNCTKNEKKITKFILLKTKIFWKLEGKP